MSFVPCSARDTEEAQADLASLCADRPFDPVELFAPNAYYGLARIVKAYAGAPEDRPLKIALPHGVECHTPRVGMNIGRREAVPVVGTYADGYARYYREQGNRAVWPIAHPLLYLQRMLAQRAEPSPERAGTIFFPTHSGLGNSPGELVRSLFDLEGVLARLDALRPVTVCLYWVDLRHGLAEPYERAGMRVVSAGHMADPQFLARFVHLCAAHRYAASNDIGSHCFYAIAAGCEYRHLDAPSTWENSHIDTTDDPLYRETRELVSGLTERPAAEQAGVADRFLGARHLAGPEDVRAMIERAERVDRLGAWPARRRLAAITRPLRARLRP